MTSDKVKPVECDCCGGTWGYINADGEHDNVYDCVGTLTQQRDEARRQREETSSQLWDCMNERDGWKHRAERMAIDHTDALDAYRQMYESELDRAERMAAVVDLLRIVSVLPSPDLLTDGDWADLCDAVRALDAAEAHP